MIISILILILSPDRTDKKADIVEKNNKTLAENEKTNTTDLNKINSEEEKETSMQKGGNFLKNGDNIVFYKIDDNKTIYTYNINEKKVEKLAKGNI